MSAEQATKPVYATIGAKIAALTWEDARKQGCVNPNGGVSFTRELFTEIVDNLDKSYVDSIAVLKDRIKALEAAKLSQEPVSRLDPENKLYRKKSAIFEAYQYSQSMAEAHLFDGAELPEGLRLGSASYHKASRIIWHCAVVCPNKVDALKVFEGDWIIKNSAGEYYPCSSGVFADQYEPIKSEDATACLTESAGQTPSVFPSRVCHRREDEQECEFVGAGVGLQCRACKKYLHPGDDGFGAVKDYYDQVDATESASIPSACLTESVGWLPISSAPKDGTILLLINMNQSKGMAVSWWSSWRKVWITSGGVEIHQPTHWMPLPPPPQAVQQEEDK